MMKRKIREINMNISSTKKFQNNNILNSLSKSNISTSNFSYINPDKNIKTIDSYEDFYNKYINNINGNEIKKFLLNSPKNIINNNNNKYEPNTEYKKKAYKNIIYPKKNIIYKKINQKCINLNNNCDINIDNSIILNEYRKRIMKLFLSSFRNYCFIFIRKYFYSFIRNITYLIMRKELFYKTNSKIKTKNLKINNSNNIYLNKSYENLQILNKDNYINNRSIQREKSNYKYFEINSLTNKNSLNKNYRYNLCNSKIDEDNYERNQNIQLSNIYSNTINIKDKVYEFKNIFISSDSRNKKYINAINTIDRKKHYKCFMKKIKDIITPDKRLYIRINYIYLTSKRKQKSKKNEQKNLEKMNNLLSITQIYSFEYLSNNSNINTELEEKIIIMVETIENIFINKEEKRVLYQLKLIKMVKCIEKLIKILIFKKLRLSNRKDSNFSNGLFLLDDKIVINIDNFSNSDVDKNI